MAYFDTVSVTLNFSSEEDMRFLKMFGRFGMTSKSAFIKARIFGEPFRVSTFDKISMNISQVKRLSCSVPYGRQPLGSAALFTKNYYQTLKRVEKSLL